MPRTKKLPEFVHVAICETCGPIGADRTLRTARKWRCSNGPYGKHRVATATYRAVNGRAVLTFVDERT